MVGSLGCQTASLRWCAACRGHAIALPPALFVPVFAHAFPSRRVFLFFSLRSFIHLLLTILFIGLDFRNGLPTAPSDLSKPIYSTTLLASAKPCLTSRFLGVSFPCFTITTNTFGLHYSSTSFIPVAGLRSPTESILVSFGLIGPSGLILPPASIRLFAITILVSPISVATITNLCVYHSQLIPRISPSGSCHIHILVSSFLSVFATNFCHSRFDFAFPIIYLDSFAGLESPISSTISLGISGPLSWRSPFR